MSLGLPTNVQLVEDSATNKTGNAVPGTANLTGARAATGNPTNTNNGSMVAVMADQAGRIVVTEGTVRDLGCSADHIHRNE